MKVNIEYTDTYGGESNYSWVRRESFEGNGLSDRSIVRRAKALMGLTGTRCKRDSYGDMIALWYPDNSATVLFITFD